MTPKIQQEETPVPYYLRPNELQQDMNSRMAELIPELNSSLAQTPMLRNRWYAPSEDYEEGVPCFIPVHDDISKGGDKQPPAMKKDYIFMPAKKQRDGLGLWKTDKKDVLPAGYYHLSTQEAYIEIYHLFRLRRSRRKVACFGKKTEEYKLDSKIHDLLYNRLISDLPDDVHAARMRVFLLRSQGGRAKAFGKSAYLPTLTTTILLGLSH